MFWVSNPACRHEVSMIIIRHRHSRYTAQPSFFDTSSDWDTYLGTFQDFLTANHQDGWLWPWLHFWRYINKTPLKATHLHTSRNSSEERKRFCAPDEGNCNKARMSERFVLEGPRAQNVPWWIEWMLSVFHYVSEWKDSSPLFPGRKSSSFREWVRA